MCVRNFARFALFCVIFLSLFNLGAFTRARAERNATEHPFHLEIRTPKNGQKELWQVSPETMLLGKLEILPAHSKFYHWTMRANAERWNKQGSVDAKELEYLMRGNGRQGGGFYTSKHLVDSMTFGKKLVEIELPGEVTVLDVSDGWSEKTITNGLHAALKELGIQGIFFNHRTWVNFIDPAPLSKIRSVNEVTEFFKDENTVLKNAGLKRLLELDQRYPLKTDPWLEKNFPLVEKLLTANPSLTQQEMDRLMPEAYKALVHAENPYRPTAFVSKITGVFHEQFVKKASDELRARADQNAEELAILEKVFRNLNQYYGIRLSDIQPGLKGPSAHFIVQSEASSDEIGEFGKKLARSFEFIDLNDLLDAMARNRPDPWTLYDNPNEMPLIDRWNQSIQAFKKGTLVSAHQILSGESETGFRDAPITAGGDIMVAGKGYYRITEKQKTVLESNPFLKVEIREDPFAKPGTKTYLARHSYPSVENFRKYKEHLDSKLLQSLERAEQEGVLADHKSLEYRALNQEMLKELCENVLHSGRSELLTYQRLISIHPFNDYNGRTMRAWFEAQTGHPLFLRNWDLDLLLSPREFVAYAVEGESELSAIREGFAREYAKNPHFPRFYDAPEPWQVAAGVDRLAPSSERDFVEKSKSWFEDPQNSALIHQKLYYDVYQGLRGGCLKAFLRARF